MAYNVKSIETKEKIGVELTKINNDDKNIFQFKRVFENIYESKYTFEMGERFFIVSYNKLNQS